MGGKNSYESIKRYQDKAYDKILVRLPKGQKDTIQAHAQSQGESVNAFIGRAITEAIESSENSFILDEKTTGVICGEEYDIYYRKRFIKCTDTASKDESEG